MRRLSFLYECPPVSPDYEQRTWEPGVATRMDCEIRARVAYLRGLTEGLEIDETAPEGRLLRAIIDVLDDLAGQFEEMAESHSELLRYVEDVDADLSALEDVILREDGEAAEEPDEDDDEVEQILCPECGEPLAVRWCQAEAALDVVCPHCGRMIGEGGCPDGCDEED